jgi:hypothetical protein
MAARLLVFLLPPPIWVLAVPYIAIWIYAAR